MHLANYLDALTRGEATLGAAFEAVGQGHQRDAGVYYICRLLSGQCQAHTAELAPVAGRYAERREEDLDRLHVPASARSAAAATRACCATCRTST